MVHVLGNETHCGCIPRAATAGDAVCMAGTGNAVPKSQVCSEPPRVGEP